eukprot:scaffold18126_cov140-Skeletonema_marinoi.AAC.3
MSQSVLSNCKLPHTALRELLGSRSAGPPSAQNDQLLSELRTEGSFSHSSRFSHSFNSIQS